MKRFWAFTNRAVCGTIMGFWDLFAPEVDYPFWLKRFDDYTARKGGFDFRRTLRVFRLGNLEHKFLPSRQNIDDLARMLAEADGNEACDLIWGPDLKVDEYVIEPGDVQQIQPVAVYEKRPWPITLKVFTPHGEVRLFSFVEREDRMDLKFDVIVGGQKMELKWEVTLQPETNN